MARPLHVLLRLSCGCSSGSGTQSDRRMKVGVEARGEDQRLKLQQRRVTGGARDKAGAGKTGGWGGTRSWAATVQAALLFPPPSYFPSSSSSSSSLKFALPSASSCMKSFGPKPPVSAAAVDDFSS